MDWATISRFQHISVDFIRENKDKVDKLYILLKQNPSKDFILQFNDKLNWKNISVSKYIKRYHSNFKVQVAWWNI